MAEDYTTPGKLSNKKKTTRSASQTPVDDYTFAK